MSDRNEVAQFLSSEEVAKLFSVTERTLRAWRKKKYIPYIKVGKTVRFVKSDVINAFKNHIHG